MGSNQDTLAPLETSLVQVTERMHSLKNCNAIKEMQKNIISQCGEQTVYRIAVDFDLIEDSLETYIGRKAHIQFIDNSELIKMILYRYSYLFE